MLVAQITMATTTDQSEKTSGVLAPPPLLYLGGLGLGLALDRRFNTPKAPPSVGRPIGVALLVGGGVLAARFVRAFRQANTAIDLRKPSTSLVTSGPYRFTRNPGYLSLTVMYFGATVVVGGVCSLATLVPVLVTMDRYVIRREEEYLSERFGADYRSYQASVGRWL
jgi:protein-S-isoprenylcysteine O-methyltransferase Ste14